MLAKKKLLFITPVTPSLNGSGLSIRAYHNLFALAQIYSIDLVVMSTWNKRTQALHKEVVKICAQVFFEPMETLEFLLRRIPPILLKRISLGYFPKFSIEFFIVTKHRHKQLQNIIGKGKYHCLHIFRLYMAPLVFPLSITSKKMTIQLDLDDLDYDYHMQLSEYYGHRGLSQQKRRHGFEAQYYFDLEQKIIPFCSRLFVTSEKDQILFATRHPESNVSVLPNIAPLANLSQKQHIRQSKKLLFIGSLGYLPNLDGLKFFIEDVWPLVKKVIPDCRLVVAGRGLPKIWQNRLGQDCSVEYLGEVETVDDVYHQANASIIPIRLGGGTRIKALEAFDRSCPVISTCQGVYGLDVEHNKHLLVADETTEFARACCKILTDDKLVTELTTHAFQFVKEYYTIERLTEILKRCG